MPVVYGGEFGIDLEAVAERAELTPEEVIARHSGADYRVYMLGFLPGFTYLGGLDPKLATPRRQEPRLEAPAGMIAIGGVQTGIQCIAAPSGWNIFGRTPVRTYHPGRDPIFLIEPGDHVTFFPVPASEWDALDRAGEAGEMVAEIDRRMSFLVVDKVGPATSVQDKGRSGAQRYGLTPSGAMDLKSLAIANALVGQTTGARPRSRSARSGLSSGPWGAACASRSQGPTAPPRSAGEPLWVNETALIAEGDGLRRERRAFRRLQLSRRRGRHRGRAGLRQLVGFGEAPGSAAPIRGPFRPATGSRSAPRKSKNASGASSPFRSSKGRSGLCWGRRTTP